MKTSVLESQLSNGAAPVIDISRPYVAKITIEGVAPLIMHAWNCAAVEAKATAAKNSRGKKVDDLESYVYRTQGGLLGVPGVNFVAALKDAGRWQQDPRSPRASMKGLVGAGVVSLDEVAPFIPAVAEWDYEDMRRVTVQRAAITRVRPAMRAGWRVAFSVMVTTPEYIGTAVLSRLVGDAGRLSGLCDFRPSYGRFVQTGLEIEQ